jgi:hypothetical protein
LLKKGRLIRRNSPGANARGKLWKFTDMPFKLEAIRRRLRLLPVMKFRDYHWERALDFSFLGSKPETFPETLIVFGLRY